MVSRAALGVFAAIALAGGATAQEARKAPACASIMAICMKRAGAGHAGICEDMYRQARNTGQWPATEEPNGRKHPATPCTP